MNTNFVKKSLINISILISNFLKYKFFGFIIITLRCWEILNNFIGFIVKKKIKIAGAGISGITSAINLVKRGYDVEIYEKKETIAHRFNGDFQGIENWTTPEDALDLIRNYGI